MPLVVEARCAACCDEKPAGSRESTELLIFRVRQIIRIGGDERFQSGIVFRTFRDDPAGNMETLEQVSNAEQFLDYVIFAEILSFSSRRLMPLLRRLTQEFMEK